MLRSPERAAEGMRSLFRVGMLGGLGGALETLHALAVRARERSAQGREHVLRLLDLASNAIKALIDDQVRDRDDLRPIADATDIALASVRGALRAGLASGSKGFDVLDDFECRDFLAKHGASPRALDSGFLRGLYDLGFAYEDGEQPRISTAAAMRGAHRLFYTYRGAFFWKMTAGMGEIVFAPLYELLVRRGVKFEFFQRVVNVRLGSPGPRSHVEALDVDVQATTVDGRPYQPLVNVRGLPCWPSSADYAQLTDGDRLREEGRAFESTWDRRRAGSKVLRVGEDFDTVVLAVGLGAVPEVCPEIVARDERWQAMVQHVKAVPTQAFQLWMNESLPDLGWRDGAASVSGFAKPFDTWADMSHLARSEGWPSAPRSIVYFCSAMATPGGVASQSPEAWRQEVGRRATRFLDEQMGHLWPKATSGGRFRWDLLQTPPGTAPGPADGFAIRVAALRGERQPDGLVHAGRPRLAQAPGLAARRYVRQPARRRRLDGHAPQPRMPLRVP